jgi:hypothetical protein
MLASFGLVKNLSIEKFHSARTLEDRSSSLGPGMAFDVVPIIAEDYIAS